MCFKYYDDGPTNRKQIGISYKYLIIVLMVISTTFAVIDRFTTNLWPLYLDHPESPIFADDWTASTFIIIGWICGRELIVSSSFIYLLQCRCFMNYLFERKPKWLLCDDIALENKKLHYHIGWLCVALPLLVHAWLVFLPLFKPGNSLTMYHQWMRPIDEQTGFYLDNYHQHHINIAYNDLYALIVVTLCFMLLFPLSMSAKLRDKRYALATYLHLIAAALYGVELIRTPFTIHCWFFCAPIMALYVADRLYGVFWYRATSEAKLICKYNIDNDYVVLFLHVPHLPSPATMQCSINDKEKEISKYLGNVYYLNLQRFVRLRQFAHPFTTFYNHCNELYGDIESSFLFSSTMRHTLSHRSHRFPIRTSETHQHVASQEFQSSFVTDKGDKSQQQTFTLMRTETALTGVSLSGLKVNEEDMETPHNSPSESAKAHHYHLLNLQQSQLRKLSERNEQEQSYRHQRNEALSVVRSGRHDQAYILPSNHSTPSFGATGAPKHVRFAQEYQPRIPPVPIPKRRQRHVRSLQKKTVILPMSDPLKSPTMPTMQSKDETEDDDTETSLHDSNDEGDLDREPLHEDTVNSPTIATLATLPTAVGPSYAGRRESYQDTQHIMSDARTISGSLQTEITHNVDTLTATAFPLGDQGKSPSPEHCKSTTLQSVTITYHNTKPLTRLASSNASSKPSTRGPSFDTVIEEQLNEQNTIVESHLIEEDRSSDNDDANQTDKLSIPRPLTVQTYGSHNTTSVYKSDFANTSTLFAATHSNARSHALTTDRRSTVKTFISDLSTGDNTSKSHNKRWKDKNLWIDEKTKEEFEWNVGVIMKVHQKETGVGFTQYVRDFLGWQFAANRNRDRSEAQQSKSPRSDNKGSYVRCQMHEKGDTEKYQSADSNPSVTIEAELEATHLYCYGPYRSGFGHVMTECLVNQNPVVLIGTGAGIGYILDFLLETRTRNIDIFPSRVDIHFSCRSVKLFQWVTDVICGPKVKQQEGLHINAHLTGYENVVDYQECKKHDDECSYRKKRNAKIGRASFQSVLRNAIVNTKVFFCGNATIQCELEQLCEELNLKLYKSHAFQ